MTEVVQEYSPKRYSHSNLERTLEGNRHQHSYFVDVRGKGATFESMDFAYCVFIRAYFHNAIFVNCRFAGSHFIDCNFRNAEFRDCDFSYARFNGTTIPSRAILRNLPAWPNVRRELLQILRINSTSVGDYKSERVFVINEIEAEKEHYRRAWRQEEQYYRKKYPGWKGYRAGLSLLALKIDNFVWGHGERLWKTMILLLIFLMLVTIITTIVWTLHMGNPSFLGIADQFARMFVYHVNTLLGVPDTSGIEGTLLVDWSVIVVRYVLFGMLWLRYIAGLRIADADHGRGSSKERHQYPSVRICRPR